MAAEAGEEEFLGRGVPVHVDGHAGLRLEAFAQGDVEGEESDDALVGGAIVRSELGLGLLAEVSPEVSKAGLLGEVLVVLECIGGICLELSEGDEALEGAVECAVMLERTGLSFFPGLGEDDDVLLPLGLSHVLGENLMRQAEGFLVLVRPGELFVERLDNVTADELTADSLGLRGALTRRPHREVVCGGEVEADGRAVSEERHDGGGRFERRADHRERTFRGRLDSLQEPAAREIVAVIQTQGVRLHGSGENSSLRP